MTVGELIILLQAIPPTRNIYMASDPEGNTVYNVAEIMHEEWFNWQADAIVIWPGQVAAPPVNEKTR